MVSRINLYVAFVFCGILFVVDAYPEKRHGKKIQFLASISISYYTETTWFARVFCNEHEQFADYSKET